MFGVLSNNYVLAMYKSTTVVNVFKVKCNLNSGHLIQERKRFAQTTKISNGKQENTSNGLDMPAKWQPWDVLGCLILLLKIIWQTKKIVTRSKKRLGWKRKEKRATTGDH
jgi:hypothetical protein